MIEGHGDVLCVEVEAPVRRNDPDLVTRVYSQSLSIHFYTSWSSHGWGGYDE